MLLEHGELHEVVLGDAPDCFDCVELARVWYIFEGPEVSLHDSHRLVRRVGPQAVKEEYRLDLRRPELRYYLVNEYYVVLTLGAM